MITNANGNLLAAEVDALVNTVNTEGVMGKGIALQFKKAYPAMFDAYRKAAKSGELRLGKMQVWHTGQMAGPKFVINFPTKGHWKSRSRIVDIETGLADLVRTVRELGISSIAVPPLGCGNGGLDWADVKPRITAAFDALPDVDVRLFAPSGPPAAAEMRNASGRPHMTQGRAALVALIHRYTAQSLMAPGLIESQKLLYFLQEAGEPLKLRYDTNRYGPYADNLRHVFNAIEGHFLSGYGDGSIKVSDAEALTVLPGATQQAESVLNHAVDTQGRIERVLDLASGFESAYGLELLATVHWLVTRRGLEDDSEVARQVQGWSPRKARMFTANHIEVALEALREQEWLPSKVNA